ncbi:hypothetical protein V502_09957 [Pseudogymnoascus sp. VKM F-4520 (FW-2644)]|nr:hypothetical protein V502_09957 [Pseudogymnoascus sp. VKM F-4520 (FW-2644)]
MQNQACQRAASRGDIRMYTGECEQVRKEGGTTASARARVLRMNEPAGRVDGVGDGGGGDSSILYRRQESGDNNSSASATTASHQGHQTWALSKAQNDQYKL